MASWSLAVGSITADFFLTAPYPENGVGFEAGPYVTYLAECRLWVETTACPQASDAHTLADKALAIKADYVAV